MKIIILVIFILILLILLIAVGILLLAIRGLQFFEYQKFFSAGKLPNPSLNGFYIGSIKGTQTNWRGKKFAEGSGVDVYDINGQDIEKHTFKTYVSKGVHDKNADVLSLDYNQKGNPLWQRFIREEVIMINSRQFLGKAHVKILPFFSITLNFFLLEK